MLLRHTHRILLSLSVLTLLGTLTVACKTSKAPVAPRPDYVTQDTLLAHDSFTLKSAILGEERRIAVYLPPEYAASPERSFPVLYMPDGGVKEDFPHVSFAIDELIKEGAIEPILVVGVANTDRFRDLTSPTQVRREKKRAPQAGGAQRFFEFFEQEVKAAIARRYRVADRPTAIVGESMAARWIVEGWLTHPERYEVWIAIDPSLWWNNSELIGWAEQKLGSAKPKALSRLYLSGAYRGEVGNLPDVHRFADTLRGLGVPPSQVVFESYPGYEHSEIFRQTEQGIYRKMLRN